MATKNFKYLLSSVAFLAMLAVAPAAHSYETTTFSVSLGDATKTGTMSLGNGTLGNGTASLSAGGNSYNVAYQYFTPVSTGTYVFGQLSSPVDSVILLYSPTYTPGTATSNFIQMNDDGSVGSIADAALRTYVTTAIASRSCGNNAGLCPLLSTSLTSGVDYYVVVSTYSPGSSLGASSDTLSFFVVGADTVGVGGQPPVVVTPPSSTDYVDTAAPGPASQLASYLGGNDGGSGMTTLVTYLNGASESEVTEAMREIFPVNASLAPQVMGGSSGQTVTVLIDKVGTVLGSINTPSAAALAEGSFNTSNWLFGDAGMGGSHSESVAAFMQEDADPTQADSSGLVTGFSAIPYQKFEKNGQAFWIQGVGALTHGDEKGLSYGYDVNSAGVVTGYEHAVGGDNLLGVIASAFRTEVDMDANTGNTDAATYSLGLYGQHLWGGVKLTGVFLASYSKYDSERYVDVGGVAGTPRADYDGWGTSTTLNVSKLFEQDALKIEPFLSANFSTASTDGYTESGGGVYNMSVSSDTSSTATAKTGVTFQYGTALLSRPIELKARPYVGYQWAIDDAGNAVRIVGASSSVAVDGRDINGVQYGLALETKLNVTDASSFKLGVDVSHDKNEDSGVAFVGYGLKF